VALLERERERLQASLRVLAEAERTLAESQGEESDAGGEAADVASDLAEQEIDLTVEEVERAHLAEVEAALHRVAVGSYGRCEQCGGPIELARLQALPWARFCLSCARKVGHLGPASPGR